MIPTRLVLVSAPAEPWPWLTVSDDGAILQRGVLLPDAPPPDTPVIDRMVVPGADVVARWLDLPDRNDRQARSAVAFLLQDDIADEAEDLHICVGGSDAGGQRLATVTTVARVQGWLDAAAARGVRPVSVTPDYLTLRPDDAGQTLVAGFGWSLAVRGPGLAFAAERPLAEAVLGDRPRRMLALNELEPMLAGAALLPEINLLQGVFGPRSEQPVVGNVRRMIILALALLVSPVVLGVAQVGVDLIAARQAESRAVAGARAIWPRAVPAGSGMDVVRTRLAAQQTSDRFADLAADLFAAIERTPGAQIDSLAYGPAGLSAALSYANYSDMDQLITAGGRVGLLITADSTVTEGGRITSDISVRRQP
jgi:general secretion pathway protein L